MITCKCGLVTVTGPINQAIHCAKCGGGIRATVDPAYERPKDTHYLHARKILLDTDRGEPFIVHRTVTARDGTEYHVELDGKEIWHTAHDCISDFQLVPGALRKSKTAEIASLQQELSDCQASLRAVEAALNEAREDHERYRERNIRIRAYLRRRAVDAEARVKLVRAETIEECAKVAAETYEGDPWSIKHTAIATAIRALDQTEPGDPNG